MNRQTHIEPTFRDFILGSVLGKAVLGVITLIIALLVSFKSFETLDANQYMVIQYPNGHISAFSEPGIKPQWFGSVQKFDRSFQHWFDEDTKRTASGADESIKIRFNDGGHAQISGSVRVDLPTEPGKLMDLYRTYHTQENIQKALVDTVIEKSIYMTGPLMTSKESYAERRNELLSLIEDQAMRGVYQTKVTDALVEDPIATAAAQAQAAMKATAAAAATAQPTVIAPGGVEAPQVQAAVVVKKLTKLTEIKVDTATGKQLRQEESPLERYGIDLSNLSINSIKYDATVEKQIAQQQEAVMSVQTAVAEARKAEQQKITTEATGAAEAAKAKWEQEKEKARAVVIGEQEKEVAALNAEKAKNTQVTAAQAIKEAAQFEKEAAELKKLAMIAEGEGKAQAAKLVMEANGALELKLTTYQAVMSEWAKSFSTFRGSVTPQVVMGSTGNATATGANGVADLINLLTVKTAKDLSLDLSIDSGLDIPRATGAGASATTR